jgi:hypothetical protein
MLLLFLLANLHYIDQPHIQIPSHGTFDIQLRFGPQGEILGFFDIGVWDRFAIGISYGAANLIGAGDPKFYEVPGVQVKVKAIQGYVMPDLVFGFDNQGLGGYDGARYAIMSKGFYTQIGTTFGLSGVELVPSIGANYSFEAENHFDMFSGLEARFGSSSALLFDFSPNFNDNTDQNKGYLNASLKFIFYEELFFECALRDILDNSPETLNLGLNRMVRIGYEQSF